MFKKELTKIAIASLVGFVIGLIYALAYESWSSLYMMPLYAIGITYSYQYLINMISAIFKWFAGVAGFSIGSTNCCGFAIGVGVFLVLIYCVVSYVWIAGLALAVWALFQAIQQDGMIVGLQFPFRTSRKRHDDDDGWSSWGVDNTWDDDRKDNWGDSSKGNPVSWDDDDSSW